MQKAIGIICEYNPFHNGHLHHLNEIKRMYPNYTIVLVMSGFFTQRGDFSILTKYEKTQIALEMGIDLVIELPFSFATQSADIFAYGAIKILSELKVEKLVFGSECNDCNLLKSLVDIQLSDDYNLLIKKFLKEGINYPTALSKALSHFSNYELKSPNDLLGISYIRNIKELNSNIEPISIKRTSDYHSLKSDNNIISASAIRELINQNKSINQFVPKTVLKHNFININANNIFNYLKFKIISDHKILNNYQTVDEGIEHRLIKYINECDNLNDFILKTKSKRYTYNKIKRMLIHILCSFTKEEAKIHNEVKYIRILGINNNGKSYLNEIKKEITIPVISKFSAKYSNLLELEKRVTNIYSIIFNLKHINKEEYQNFPIIND